MEHKQAIAVLLNLLKTNKLAVKEKEAVLTALGVLAWTSLAPSRAKSLKTKRQRA